jgi:hypothetical protein
VRVFEKKMQKRILGPKGAEVTGGWRELHNEEFRDLYCSPSIIRIIKSRRMRLAGHLARMRDKRNAYRFLVGRPEGKRPIRRPRLGGWIILGWILAKKKYKINILKSCCEGRFF